MKRLVIGAALAAIVGSIAMPAAARDYYYDGYRTYRDRDHDGRPDRWERREARRHWRHRHRHDGAYYRYYEGPRYGYYDDYRRPYREAYRYRYYGW